jgi:uncharacterized protein
MDESGFLGTGWSFPPAFDNASLQLQLSSGESNINQSIDLLLNTPKGSRSLLPDFGSALSRYTFRRLDATLQEQLIQSVKTTLLEGEPRITVERVDVTLTADGATADVLIAYQVRETNTRHNHVYPFSLLEGSNLELGA